MSSIAISVGSDMSSARTIETLMQRYPPDVQALAGAARELIRRLLPGVSEQADSTAPVIGFSYGPGYRGLVCTLILSKSGVKLGLVGGAELDDPRGLLEGSGKVHRYIQLRAPGDLRRAGINGLIRAAHQAWKNRNARR